jgi:photosystem II stability/assembly factor-like uncharacterized protein
MQRLIYGFFFLAVLSSCKKKVVDTIPTVKLQQIPSPTDARLTSVQFISSNEGFIGGAKGKIYKTANAGGSWTDISLPTDLYDITKVCFRTPLTGLAACSDGIFRTIDGGTTWTHVLMDFHVNDVQMITATRGFAAGEEGFPTDIMTTYDGGGSWFNVSASYIYSEIYAVSFVNVDTGYLASEEGKIFQTLDGGTTWTQYFSTSTWGGRGYSGPVGDLAFVGYQDGIVAGKGGYLNDIIPGYTSTDVRSIPLIDDYGYDLSAVATRNGHSVAVGRYSVLMPYPEFGSGQYSWNFYLAPDGTTLKYQYNDVAFADDYTYYAVGDNGVITRFTYPSN